MRKSKSQYLMGLAMAAAERGTCDRFRAGCVIARDGIVIATGYNGSAPDDPHCDEAGHDLVAIIRGPSLEPGDEKQETSKILIESGEAHCVRTIHAEINAILNAAYLGVSAANADWYVNGISCMGCSRAIARLRPRSLHFIDGYRNGANLEWWRDRQRRLNAPEKIHLYREGDL